MNATARPSMRSRLLLAVSIGATAAGCFLSMPQKRVATPAELEQFGTRTYPGYDRKQVQQATITALRVQGYEIVTDEPRIRTAPKLAHVSSAASYSQTSGTSQTFAESVAWDIDVQQAGENTTLHAVPRASVNGIPMEQVYYDWAERTFAQLMKEVDASLPAKH